MVRNESFPAVQFRWHGADAKQTPLWLDSGRDRDSGAHFQRYAAAFEYGITNHWMVDGFAGWLDPADGATSLQRLRAETRIRFGEEGDHCLDVAASFETEYEPEGEEPQTRLVLIPRLVLSRDLSDQFNVTLNLDLAREIRHGAADRWTPGYALAVRYPREALLRYGVELREDFAEEHSSLLVPQVWFSFPHDATLKLGAGRALEGEARQDFVRLVFEIEF